MREMSRDAPSRHATTPQLSPRPLPGSATATATPFFTVLVLGHLHLPALRLLVQKAL